MSITNIEHQTEKFKLRILILLMTPNTYTANSSSSSDKLISSISSTFRTSGFPTTGTLPAKRCFFFATILQH